jgi:hypothetical protein
MNDGTDLVDCIREVRMILADSIDTLLNLESCALDEKPDEIVPITSAVELVDMSYYVAESQKIKSAESELMRRQSF